MSPTCDEFVLALYPPRRARLLESEATDLTAAMRKLLNAIAGRSECLTPSTQSSEQPSENAPTDAGQEAVSNQNSNRDKQIEILDKAIEHNSSKLLTFLNAKMH